MAHRKVTSKRIATKASRVLRVVKVASKTTKSLAGSACHNPPASTEKGKSPQSLPTIMNLLQEIQESIIDGRIKLGPIFLKLRLLAARLGSYELEEWVKFESEGYPTNTPLPDYRKISVEYTSTFPYSDGSGKKSISIPSNLIEEIAGKYEIRQSIAAIDDLVESSAKKGGLLEIGITNPILILNFLRRKILEDHDCNDIRGAISKASLAELQYVVKSRVLKLTIEIEKSIPEATDISFGSRKSTDREMSSKVTHISNQIFHGNVTSITSSGDNASFSLSINPGDSKAFKKYLIDHGIDEVDVNELSEIVSSEAGGDKSEPLGEKATKWLAENIKKATDGTWKVGISVATELIKKAALKYYGLG